MILFEREKQLRELSDLLCNIKNGKGILAVVSGEAGIGKTSLVELFTEEFSGDSRVLWGACDALFTPRPLGPLYDIMGSLNNKLLGLLDSQASRNQIFPALLKNLQENKSPNIVVFEDVHWADEATLDLIKFLARRAGKSNSLLIITFRDDEVKSDHPLRLVLGDIPSQNIRKLKLPPLSEKIVNNLAAGSGINNLFQVTGGNPFLVTELITAQDQGIPSTIQDSLITRISRLSSEAKELIETVSVIPTHAEIRLLKKIINVKETIIDESSDAGILKVHDGFCSFKHELSRMAVEQSLGESRREGLNKKVLEAILGLNEAGNYLARIVHHASFAADQGTILKYAPLAARQASALGAHKEAADHYMTAMKFSSGISAEEKLEILEGRSYECLLTGQINEGITACESAIDILKDHKNPVREGENYRMLSRLMWYAGQDKKGEEYLRKSIAVLEQNPYSKSLAMAYSNMSQVCMLREETMESINWGEKAIAIAEKIKDIEVEIHALNNIGTVKMYAGDDSGKSFLEKSLQLSSEHNLHDHVSRAYDNLGAVHIYRRSLPEAEMYYSMGIEYCSDKDLHSCELCMTGEISKIKLYTGEWDEAVERASATLAREKVPTVDRIIPLCVIGLIRARRNDPGAVTALQEANTLVMHSGELGKIVTVKAAMAENYWLQNKLEDIGEEIEILYRRIKDKDNPWAVGEIAFWLWKAGRLSEAPQNIAEPFLLQIRGQWRSAAELWEKLRCPYEQAVALTEGNEEAKKKAVDIFNKLGAAAPSQLIKQRLRESGVRNIPKGPRESTKKNPAGLTARQLEVLHLISKGLSNSEIGYKLFISSKTVDHHVSAILSKLNLHTRLEAAAALNSNPILKNREHASPK